MDNYVVVSLGTVCLVLLGIVSFLLKREHKSSEAVKRVVSDVKYNLDREMKKYLDNGEKITSLYLISAAFSCSRHLPSSVHIDYGIDNDEWFFVILLGNECEMVSGPIMIDKAKEND